MNRQQLDALIGLDIKDAEKDVKSYGLVPDSLHQGTITTQLCIPKNMVQIRFNNHKKVISAETQASIDAKY